MKTYHAALLIIVALMLLAACQPKETEAPGAALEATAVSPETLMPTATNAAPFVPTFAAAPCFFDVPDNIIEGKDIVCGYVTVPEDHRDPAGPTIELAVVVRYDISAKHQPDPVFVLAGGPGQKLVRDAVPTAQLLTALHENRDLVLFDQRGVGFSKPALDCPEVVANRLDNLDETDDALRAETGFAAFMACRDRLVAAGHNLSAYNTWQNAADVEAIRVALGYDEINLYGGSYGSHLAQAVMRDHPDALRSAIIDSVWPLETSFFVEVTTVSNEAVLHLLESCAAHSACSAAYPDLQDALFDIIDQLNAEPVPVTLTNPRDHQEYAAYITGDEVLNNLMVFLYDTAAIPLLPQAIYDVYNGDYTLMTRLSSTKLSMMDLLSAGMELSVVCTDDLIGKTLQDQLDAMETLPPQLVDQHDEELIRKYGIFALCAAWPVEEADAAAKEPLVSDIPTLIISGEFDPVTPPEFAEVAAQYLENSYVYVFPGVGHSPIGASACARQMVAAFIENPDAPPPADCMEGMAADFVVPTDYDVMARTPVSVETLGVSTLVPAGWNELEPGVFASPDYTAALYILHIDDLDAFIAEEGLVGPVQEVEMNGRLWSIYEFPTGDPASVGLDAATPAEGRGFYDIALIAPEAQREALEADVLMPALQAFAVGDTPVALPETAPADSLEPYTSDVLSIRGVVPAGWREAAPGTFARGAAADDVTSLIQKSYAGATTEDLLDALLPQLGLETLPAPVGQLETTALAWNLYIIEVEAPGIGPIQIDLALAEQNGVPYMVLLQAPADEYEMLHSEVFTPVLEAFGPLAGE